MDPDIAEMEYLWKMGIVSDVRMRLEYFRDRDTGIENWVPSSGDDLIDRTANYIYFQRQSKPLLVSDTEILREHGRQRARYGLNHIATLA